MTRKRSLTDFQTLPDPIQKFVETLDLNPEQLNNLDWEDRDDWDPADPCPDCGSEVHAEYFVGTDFLRGSGDGTYHFSASGDRVENIGYVCADCEAELYVHPILALLFS